MLQLFRDVCSARAHGEGGVKIMRSKTRTFRKDVSNPRRSSAINLLISIDRSADNIHGGESRKIRPPTCGENVRFAYNHRWDIQLEKLCIHHVEEFE
jgi:hypothetical protein